MISNCLGQSVFFPWSSTTIRRQCDYRHSNNIAKIDTKVAAGCITQKNSKYTIWKSRKNLLIIDRQTKISAACFYHNSSKEFIMSMTVGA
jgi:hypothetical protein